MKLAVATSQVKINSNLNALEIYYSLKRKFTEEQLFLLESLSGPDKDCNQSVIGFDPLLSFTVIDDKAYIECTDSPILAEALGQALGENVKKLYTLPVLNIDDVFGLLRMIEKLFSFSSQAKGIEGLGWFGYFGYDTIFMIEDIKKTLPRENDVPVISLAIYRGIVQLDVKTGNNNLTVNVMQDDENSINSIKNLIEQGSEIPTPPMNNTYSVTPTVQRSEYVEWFNKAKLHIDIGDIYQIQLGQELRIKSDLTPLQVYQKMREQNPSPYMYYFTTREKISIIGASPEMFTNLEADGKIVMRPIAGTIKNSSDQQTRNTNIIKLKSDQKENAEHLMLVDLCRNDIARCSIPEFLDVDELMVTELYSHVIHLVSNVTGKVLNGLDKFDVIKATFPAGTMTGTPKIKAIEIIEATENSSRGIYAGTVGYFGFNDVMLSALCIRTAIYLGEEYSIRASGGIVEDSTALGEWNETLSKLGSTYLAVTGKELASESFIN